MKKLFASLALAAVVAPVWAATQTVTLAVPGMTCAACPITVKKALSKVEGVSKVDVGFAAMFFRSRSSLMALVVINADHRASDFSFLLAALLLVSVMHCSIDD